MQPRPISPKKILISNPKLYLERPLAQEERLFPYYAGYSNVFAEDLLATLPLNSGALIFDPWNGSGTTTRAAHKLGHRAFGLDLNPTMVVVAKARMLSPLEAPSLISLAKSLMERVRNDRCIGIDYSNDPLLTWFTPQSASTLRLLECAVNHTLVSNDKYIKLNDNDSLEKVSPLAAFFYVAIFRTVRHLLNDFIPSNPTWIKKPQSAFQRKRPSEEKIFDAFLSEVESLIGKELAELTVFPEGADVRLCIGNAEQLPLPDNIVDAVVSSPPYCTRIDYAVATAAELAVLRFNAAEFDNLRRRLTGTSTVEPTFDEFNYAWGSTCTEFLKRLYAHPSKASKTYYFKNHLQYFKSLSRSINEISRVLKPNGYCILVVQDSCYKEIHNDVPTIAAEMALQSGLTLVRREDFASIRSKVGINGRSRKYLDNRVTTESVLCFQAS